MSALRVPGPGLRALEDIILDLFPRRTDLERLLLYDLEVDLDRLVGDVGMSEVVFNVLKSASNQGWLPDLVEAVAKHRSHDQRLRDWIRDHLGGVKRTSVARDPSAASTSAMGRGAAPRGSQPPPVGRRRTVYDIIEGNLAFDMARMLLLLNEPNAEAVVAADSIDALAAAYAVDSTRRPIKRYLWEVCDILLDYVERAVLSRLDYNSPRSLERTNSWTLTCSVVLSRAASMITPTMRHDMEVLRLHLRAILVEVSEDGQQTDPTVPYLLDEIAACLCECATATPELTLSAIGHLALTDMTSSLLRKAITRIPHPSAELLESTSDTEYLTEYLRAASLQLDSLELLGIDLAREVRRYSLTVAYTVLHAVAGTGKLSDKRHSRANDGRRSALRGVHEALRDSGSLVLLTGDAGSGKTTVLRWIAVNLAREQLPALDTHPWFGHVPFVLTLRRYVKEDLPDLEELSKEVAGALYDRQPVSWCSRILRAGRAVILIDGLDEVPTARRSAVQQWFHKLILLATGDGKRRGRSRLTPTSRNVIILTSRPAAVTSGDYDLSGFRAVGLADMGQQQVARFVRDWHLATAEVFEPVARVAHMERADSLMNEITSSNALLDLARTPLLCAVLCALNYSNPGGLPDRRIRVYGQALAMMLGRQDREKGVYQEELGPDEREVVLQGLAEWFTISGFSEANREDVRARLATLVGGLHRTNWTAEEVLRDLLERSGVLREPSLGAIDFIHRSFQEYLAAKSLVSSGGIGLLERRLGQPDWSGLVSTAAGYASTMYPPHWSRLIGTLVDRLDRSRRTGRASQRRAHLRNLLVDCLNASAWVDPAVYQRALPHLQEAIPPRTMADVDSVIAMGPVALPLLERALTNSDMSVQTASLCVKAAAGIGTPAGIGVVATACRIFGTRLLSSVIEAWRNFEPARYASEAIAAIAPDQVVQILILDENLVQYGRYLPAAFEFVVDLDVVTADFPAKCRGSRIGVLRVTAPQAVSNFDFLLDVVGLREVELRGVARFGLSRRDKINSTIERIDLLTQTDVKMRTRIECSAFACFRGLAELRIDGHAAIAELGQLERLDRLDSFTIGESCEIQWQDERLAHPSLKELIVDGYDHWDLTPIAGCVALEELRLEISALTSLSGIEHMTKLRRLDISGSSEIEDVDLLLSLPRLEEAEIGSCSAISPVSVFRCLVAEIVDQDAGVVANSDSLFLDEHVDDYRFGTSTDGSPDRWEPDALTEWCERRTISVEGQEDLYDEGVTIAFPDQGEISDTGEYLDGWIVGVPEYLESLERLEQWCEDDDLIGILRDEDTCEDGSSIDPRELGRDAAMAPVVPLSAPSYGFHDILVRAVREKVLTALQAEVIESVKLDGVSVETIARSLDLSVQRIDTELSVALAALRPVLQPGAFDSGARSDLVLPIPVWKLLVPRRSPAGLLESGPTGSLVQVRLDIPATV
jgi:hypothetical protein